MGMVRPIRYLLEPDEVLVAADRDRKGAMQIICGDGIDRGGPQDGHKIRDGPLARQALRTGRPVVRGDELATVIPWSSDRNGLLIGRGLAGDDGDRGQAAASLDRVPPQDAAPVRSIAPDKWSDLKAIAA